MNILNIEESAFELMMARFEALAQKVEQLCNQVGDKNLKQWLDGGEVCRILNISKRTLQTYRDNGTITYSRIGNVIFYRPEDVAKLLKKAA